MRIRDYIRDDPLMGQKRDNKSGLQGGEFSLWFSGAKSSRKTCPVHQPDFGHQTKAGIFRAVIRAFLPHLILAAIDFRYTKPHVT